MQLITWRRLLPTGKPGWKLDWYWLLKQFCMMPTESWEHLPSRLLTTGSVTWDKGRVYKWEGKWFFPQPLCDDSNRCVRSREVKIQWPATAVICIGSSVCMWKTRAKDVIEKSSDNIMAFPKTAKIVLWMGSEEKNQDFWKIKEVRCWSTFLLEQKFKKSKGWTAKGVNGKFTWSMSQYSETDNSF